MLELEARHTHLYPGAQGRVIGGTPGDGPVTLRFADGASAAGTLVGKILRLGPYTTAAGTPIAAKSWALAFAGETFRITARTA